MLRHIQQNILIKKDINEVFKALVTPSMIKKWWSAATAIVIPENDGIYALTWGEDENTPDYIWVAKIVVFDPPKKLLLTDVNYRSKKGKLPFEADFVIEFQLKNLRKATRVSVRNTGFPQNKAADEFYDACIKGWKDTLASFKKTVEIEQVE